jgi:hypothetical protein
MSLLHYACVLELVLEEEQIVCGCYSNYIFCRVPRCVEDFFIEVEAVHTDLILLAFPPRTHLNKITVKQTFLWQQCYCYGVGAQSDPCTETIFDLLCVPIWVLISPDSSTTALWQLQETSTAKQEKCHEKWPPYFAWQLYFPSKGHATDFYRP